MDDWTEVLLAEESCTWIINPNVPAADGSPETMPEVELILSPVGNEPFATDQWYGAVPPVATTALP
jgi:hypothetical protein